MNAIGTLTGSLAILVVAAQEWWAGYPLNGDQLLARCKNQSDEFCTAYIMGVADLMSAEDGLMQKRHRICLPVSADAQALRDAVVAEVYNNPNARSDPAHFVVMIALLREYPCR